MLTNLKGASIQLKNGQSFHVVGERILINPVQDSGEYAKGILKPDTNKRYAKWGVVEQIGRAEGFDIGEKVLLDPYTGTDYEIDDRDYKILHPNNVLCRIVNGKLTPTAGRTIISPIENEETKSTGGIILAVTVKEKYADVGIVYESDEFKAGDTCTLPPYAYKEFEFDGKIFFVVYTEDILGVIKG
jgi:co-chaperonin GroES (HSP10)